MEEAGRTRLGHAGALDGDGPGPAADVSKGIACMVGHDGSYSVPRCPHSAPVAGWLATTATCRSISSRMHEPRLMHGTTWFRRAQWRRRRRTSGCCSPRGRRPRVRRRLSSDGIVPSPARVYISVRHAAACAWPDYLPRGRSALLRSVWWPHVAMAKCWPCCEAAAGCSACALADEARAGTVLTRILIICRGVEHWR